MIAIASFSPDGKTIVMGNMEEPPRTGSVDETARLWDVPVPVEGTVERIGLWTKIVTGMELDDAGVPHVLDFDTWHRYREHLQELGAEPRP